MMPTSSSGSRITFGGAACSMSEEAMTPTEERPMRAPATEGVSPMPKAGSRAPAARGMLTALYEKAHHRFCLTLRRVARLRSTASISWGGCGGGEEGGPL